MITGAVMRVLIAFLVAPLCVPIALMPLFFLFVHPTAPSWAVFESVVSMVFAYGGMVVFGLPTYLLLRPRDMTKRWVTVAAGFVYGVLTMMIFLVLFDLAFSYSHEVSAAPLRELIADPRQWPVGFVLPGILGAMVGITFRRIARPHRAPLASSDQAK